MILVFFTHEINQLIEIHNKVHQRQLYSIETFNLINLDYSGFLFFILL